MRNQRDIMATFSGKFVFVKQKLQSFAHFIASSSVSKFMKRDQNVTLSALPMGVMISAKYTTTYGWSVVCQIPITKKLQVSFDDFFCLGVLILVSNLGHELMIWVWKLNQSQWICMLISISQVARGLSGGCDLTVLLMLCCRLFPTPERGMNHQAQPLTDEEAEV